VRVIWIKAISISNCLGVSKEGPWL
jgi:hypothetical protein